MAQTYGTTDGGHRLDIERRTHTITEEEPLLQGGDSDGQHSNKRVGHASLVSGIGNLANTIVGSGMLTFPLAMASSGLIPGMMTCILCGCLSGFGLYLLSLAARKTPHRRASFFMVAEMTFPRAAVFFDAAIAIKCFGVSISYLIIIKSLMPNVVAALFHDLTPPDINPPSWALSGKVWLLLIMVILAPLGYLRRLDSLRHTSYIALISVLYLVVIVVKCYFSPLEGTPAPGEIHLIHFSSSFVSTFPVQVFAFTCAQNLFMIHNELKSNTQQRINTVIVSSIGSAIGVYEIIAVFGYLTFGSNVGANIIAMYPSTTLFVAFGQLAIAFLVVFSYPLQVHPCRNCLDKIFHFGDKTIKTPAIQDGEDIDDDVDDDHGSGEMSTLKHAILTTSVILGGLAIAYTIDDLQMILSFVGSTGSTTVSFILPGLFFWKLTLDDPNTSKFLNRAALALSIYGVLVLVFCLSYNIINVIGQPRGLLHSLS